MMPRRRPAARAMSRRRRPPAASAIVLAIAGALLGSAPHGLSAQITISIPTLIANGKPIDSISPAPVISVDATPLRDSLLPSTITLELAHDGSFSTPFLVRSASGSAGTFLVDSLLRGGTRVFFRARILDVHGMIQGEQIASYLVRSWLQLLSPVRTTNDVLFTRQPTFTWNSPGITLPPGPWHYTVDVTNTASGAVEQEGMLSDTTFKPLAPLDACTSYKWRVTAQAVNGGPNDVLTVNSPGTFVIQTADCPTATIFYQNFPNPFGRGSRSVTCFWFDLARPALVTLTIYDIQLREVRHIVPGALVTAGAMLRPGAYGRQNDATQTGCDPRLQWDGRDDSKRVVPPGVYIAVFTGDGVRTTHKLLFKGE
jgi:hypothetical protein